MKNLASVAQDLFLSSRHLEDRRNSPYCGAKGTLSGGRLITQGEVLTSLHEQHREGYWCAECVEHFTEVPAARVAAFHWWAKTS